MGVTRILTLVSLIVFAQAALAAEYGLNDVSILLPLPKTASEITGGRIAMTARSPIQNGTLLPFELLKKADISFFKLIGVRDLQKLDGYNQLVTVGIRLDHCFRNTFVEKCQPQVRFVLQIVDPRNLAALDGAVHLFYNVTEEEVVSLAKQIREARNRFVGDERFAFEPLSIHPVLKDQGLRGEFFAALKNIILPRLKTQQLSRFAIFLADQALSRWFFKSFDVRSNQLTTVKIPDVGAPHLTIPHSLDAFDQFESDRFLRLPKPKAGTDQLFDVISNLDNTRDNPEKIEVLKASIERIENPAQHLPGTIDCVSCHSTSGIKEIIPFSSLKTVFTSKTLPASAMKNVTQSNFSGGETFRLFGYGLPKGEPLVGQRVINESAAVADYLNSKTNAN